MALTSRYVFSIFSGLQTDVAALCRSDAIRVQESLRVASSTPSGRNPSMAFVYTIPGFLCASPLQHPDGSTTLAPHLSRGHASSDSHRKHYLYPYRSHSCCIYTHSQNARVCLGTSEKVAPRISKADGHCRGPVKDCLPANHRYRHLGRRTDYHQTRGPGKLVQGASVARDTDSVDRSGSKSEYPYIVLAYTCRLGTPRH